MLMNLNQTYPFTLNPLPYPYNGLEPEISSEILHFHHDKHLQTYVDNLNKTLEPYKQLHSMTLEYLLTHLHTLSPLIQLPIRNNGGGVYNHMLYFNCMSPQKNQTPDEMLNSAIMRDFGSYEQFKAEFFNYAKTLFGSGYTWLISVSGKLALLNEQNQDTPLCYGTPILNIDVWEHAYYLQYQNRRPDYITAWFELINWKYVSDLYLQSIRN